MSFENFKADDRTDDEKLGSLADQIAAMMLNEKTSLKVEKVEKPVEEKNITEVKMGSKTVDLEKIRAAVNQADEAYLATRATVRARPATPAEAKLYEKSLPHVVNPDPVVVKATVDYEKERAAKKQALEEAQVSLKIAEDNVAKVKSAVQKNSKTQKFLESEYLNEVNAYINKTYDQHYATGDVQTFELIVSSGQADGFTMGSIVKYASRYGKKNGYNRKDLMKIIHYGILALYVHDRDKRG